MKNSWLRILLVVGLVAVAFALRGRRVAETPREVDSPSEASKPEASVMALFDAAEAGEDRAYLQLLTGKLRRSFEETRSQLGVEAFREDLRVSTRGIKGLAASRGVSPVGDLAAVDVDIVFVDRTERQQFLLAFESGAWRIVSISTAQAIKPTVPYGTPVFEDRR